MHFVYFIACIYNVVILLWYVFTKLCQKYEIKSEVILGLRLASEWRRYKVTPSLIGCAQTKNQLWKFCNHNSHYVAVPHTKICVAESWDMIIDHLGHDYCEICEIGLIELVSVSALLTETRMWDFTSRSSLRTPSVRAVTAYLVAE